MKKSIIFLLMIINSSYCICQNMSVQETIDYINSITPKYLYHEPWSAPLRWFKSKDPNQRCTGSYFHYLKLDDNGYITVIRHITWSYCKDNIDEGNTVESDYRRFHNSEVYLPYIKLNDKNELTIRGKTNNKAFGDSYENYALEFCEFDDSYDAQRCFNAIKYLFTKLQSDSKYSRNSQNDPFAPTSTATQKRVITETVNPQSDNNQLNLYPIHSLAVHKKYLYQGENTSETLELRYKNPVNNITYYLTSHILPANTNVQYYLEAYKNNQLKDGFTSTEITFQGKKAIYGKLQIESAYIYQLHFVNLNRGQTIQMMAGKPSDQEFEKYKNEIKITK